MYYEYLILKYIAEYKSAETSYINYSFVVSYCTSMIICQCSVSPASPPLLLDSCVKRDSDKLSILPKVKE